MTAKGGDLTGLLIEDTAAPNGPVIYTARTAALVGGAEDRTLVLDEGIVLGDGGRSVLTFDSLPLPVGALEVEESLAAALDG
jgi:hypothetical protein